MFFLRSCCASVVCLVSTILAVYVSHCGSAPAIADNYHSTLSQLLNLGSWFKSNCSQNEVDPEKDLKSCINTVIDFTATAGRLRKSPVEEFTDELSSVLKEFCKKRTTLQQCFQSSYQESSQCWMDGFKKNWPRIADLTNSVSAFACSEGGAVVTQYLAAGGSQCLLAKEEDIKVCFNKTTSAHIPTYLYATPERQLDEEDCNDIKTLQECALTHLETCETQSTAIFVNNTLNTIWNSNCLNSPAPVLERAEIQGDSNEGGFLSLFSGVISASYEAVESTILSAIVTPLLTLTSIVTPTKEASPGLNTNDGITVEENSTHIDTFPDQEDYPSEVTEDGEYSDVQGIEQTTYGNDEIELPISELGTNGTDHDPTVATKADVIVKDKLSNVDKISVVGTNITSMHAEFTTTGPPVDHASLMSHTSLLVISSYVVLSLVIIVLLITLFCESLLPKAG